ncbi:MAG: hypothetical protein Nk1A_7230 [Endomicrobiia bacterium]|nr:MAG: hypothetical protein Nk1A_7230 [Endomicrobiia bacterium]
MIVTPFENGIRRWALHLVEERATNFAEEYVRGTANAPVPNGNGVVEIPDGMIANWTTEMLAADRFFPPRYLQRQLREVVGRRIAEMMVAEGNYDALYRRLTATGPGLGRRAIVGGAVVGGTAVVGAGIVALARNGMCNVQ